MQTIQFIQDYDVPVNRVFYFFADHERLSEIYPGAFKRVKFGEDPKDANSRGSIRRISNLPLIFEETITEYIPTSTIAYKITYGSPLKNHGGRMVFISIDENKSRLNFTINFESKIPMTEFFLKNIIEKIVGEGIRKLALKFKENPNY